MSDETRKPGFFRRLFGDTPGKTDAPPPQANDEHPDVDDEGRLTVKTRPGPDADAHTPAMAPVFADEEAGARADEPAQGGITPLAEAQKKTAGRH